MAKVARRQNNVFEKKIYIFEYVFNYVIYYVIHYVTKNLREFNLDFVGLK